ncbi:MAG: GldG family protein [Spirochaetales bacterium]|nr:GldG family protein [Spirochaetales bacterium]
MNSKKKEILKILLTLFVVALVVANSLVYYFRIDATEGKIYTFSEASKQVLGGIPDNINLTYYRSDSVRKIPYLARNLNLIEDQLNEVRRLSKNKIDIKIVDPIKENLVQKMQSIGIPSQQINQNSTGSAQQNIFFTGIELEYGKKTSVIPFVFNTNNLEYELIKAISSLISQDNKQVGIIFGDDSSDIATDYPVLAALFQNGGYDWGIIEADTKFFDDYTGLLVVGGKHLDDADLVVVDQFVMSGKPVVMLVDILDVDLSNEQEPLHPEYQFDKPVFAFLEKYGVKTIKHPVLDVSSKKIPQLVQMGNSVGYPNDYLSIRLLPENANHLHPMFMNFSGLGMQWAGAFELEVPEFEIPEGIDSRPTLTSLLTTTNKSWLGVHNEVIDPRFWQQIEQSAMGAQRGAYSTVVTAQGYFESAYKGNDIPSKPGTDPIFDSLIEYNDDINLVVFSNTRFLTGLVQYMNTVRPSITMAQNIFEWLANDEVLMQVRLKENRNMELSKIQDNAKSELLKKATLWMNVLVFPLLVLITMIVVLVIRSRKKLRRFEK